MSLTYAMFICFVFWCQRSKVLAVFNLKDPQSQFGDWISLFLKAASMAEGK